MSEISRSPQEAEDPPYHTWTVQEVRT